MSRSSVYFVNQAKDNDNLTLKFIINTNLIFPYMIGIIGTVSNALLLISYKAKKNKFIEKFYMPLYLIVNQAAIVLFATGNTPLNDKQQTLADYSAYSCKFITLSFHTFSTLINWIHALVPVLLKLHLRSSIESLKRTEKFIYSLLAVFGVIYSIDFVYLELVPITDIPATNSTQTTQTNRCGIKNVQLAILRDIIDLAVYCVLPLLLILYIMIRCELTKAFTKKIKLGIMIFVILWVPVCVLPLYRDYQILMNQISADYYATHGYWVEICFTIALVLNRCIPIISSCLNAYFNKNTRVIFYRLACFLCLKADGNKLPRQSEIHFQTTFLRRKKEKNPTLKIDQIRREFYSSYYNS